jgi:hypothetical protein
MLHIFRNEDGIFAEEAQISSMKTLATICNWMAFF